MKNVIPERITHFLKGHPPFNTFSHDTLQQMARQTMVLFREKGAYIFRENDPPVPYIYIVKQGAVALLRGQGPDEVLVDICEEGGLFGLRALLAQDDYALSARAEEESLIFQLPYRGFESCFLENPQAAHFLATAFAARSGKSLQHWKNPARTLPETHFSSPLFRKDQKLLSCSPETTIRQAAIAMKERTLGSVLILNRENLPLGIVTAKDLSWKVVAGEAAYADPISSIMSSPVITAPPDIPSDKAEMLMLRHRIHHICITEDGSTQTPVLGILSQHDLLVEQASPGALIRALLTAETPEALRDVRNKAEQLVERSLGGEMPVPHLSRIVSEINDAVTCRAIELCLAEIPPPGVDFCWLALGSAGRQEQLLRTDQDNALIFADVPEADLPAVKERLVQFAKRVNEILHLCGFEYCPADMMAGNPENCLPLSAWKARFDGWIRQPTPKALMYCTIFFDYRPVYGAAALAEQLREYLRQTVQSQEVFFGLLAANALSNPPPLTFFRNFVVERSGSHHREFDIKARAMAPLADAARLLALHAGILHTVNTIQRFEQLAGVEEQNAGLYRMAAEAYEALMGYRSAQGLKDGHASRYLDLDTLSKLDQANLRNCFIPIKELQTLIEVRFRTGHFRQ